MPSRLTPDDSSARAARVWLRRAFKALHQALTAVADARSAPDIDAVHRLRVATRRAQAVLQIVAPCLPASQARKALKQLRRSRQRAAAVRDLDVMRDTLRALAGARPPRAWHSALAHLEQTLCERRAAACPPLVRRARRALGRLDDLSRALRGAIGRPREPDLRTASGLLHQLDASRRALLADMPVTPSARQHDLAGLHRARIAIKRLRYTGELAASLSPPLAEALPLSGLVALQERLGAVQDLQVLSGFLREQRAAMAHDPQAQVTIDALTARLLRRQHLLLRGVPRAWARCAPNGDT